MRAHVEIYHSTMQSKDWTASDVLPGLTIVHDGYTRLIELQNNGYACIGGFRAADRIALKLASDVPLRATLQH